MSSVETAALRQPVEFPHGARGPVTAARYRRNAKVYGALCALALLPFVVGASAGWKAFGLGLLVPGSGFFAVGGAAILLVPLTLALFWLTCVAWFWAGMVIAPLAVWLGAALLAAAAVGPAIWGPSFVLAPATVGGIYYWFRRRAQQRQAADRERFQLRQGFFAQSRIEVDERVLHEPVAGERELSEDQIAAARYVIDRALAPVGSFKGFTIIDQFQPAALRYQLNHMGFALGMLQGHYAPNFHAWLATAQRNLIESYLLPKVWDYWVLESMWGHLNFKNFDPAGKDNIMLTGWFGMHVNQYMLNSGDRRYAEPGSLTFRLNDQVAYAHSSHTLAQSVLDNLKRSDFCLYPCEPNWIYPVCNMYGMSSLAAHDAVFDTDHARAMLPQWRNMLDSEFTDEKGSIIGLRSYWTGFEVPFYAGEAGFAFFANVFSPALGRKLWAIGRKELAFCLVDDGAGRARLYFPPDALSFIDTIDPGHYRRGKLFPYAAVAMSAREFGDDELAEAAMNAADRDCGRIMQDGVLFYSDASCLANVWAVEARLMRTGDFRNSFVRGPAEGALRGPVVAEASYPDVLVAKAVSSGEDLDLVLYPGRGAGRQTLGLARLKPGASYRLTGATSSELRADDGGCASIEVELQGRTALRLAPA